MEKPNMTLKKTPMNVLKPEKRLVSFSEVALGYTAEEAREEASRCLNCPGRYCVASCPIHNHIPEFIARVREGEFEAAFHVIATSNPMPDICGRVCAHEKQCEGNCTRGIKGQPVAIGGLERFVADWYRKAQKKETDVPVPKSKRIAVVGSGPAGLSCAEALAKNGYGVTLYEARSFAGGITAYGIPNFILPNEIVTQTVSDLNKLGVKFLTDTRVSSAASLLAEGFDAVFIGTGAESPIRLNIPGEALPEVYSAAEFLTAINVQKRYLTETAEAQHKKVIVVGGGNTAMDVCRSARRTGAEVTAVYRRTEAEMPAREEDLKHAREEGVTLLPLAAPTKILGKHHVTGIECCRMEIREPDYPAGRNNVVPLPDTAFFLEADAVILALGYEASTLSDLDQNSCGQILVGKDGVTTSKPGVFAGGDAVTGAATLVSAIRGGLEGARAIDQYLYSSEPKKF